MEISELCWHLSLSPVVGYIALLCCPLRARVLIQFLIASPHLLYLLVFNQANRARYRSSFIFPLDFSAVIWSGVKLGFLGLVHFDGRPPLASFIEPVVSYRPIDTSNRGEKED